MIIERISGNISDRKSENKRIDPVYMDHYDLTKPHQKVKSKSGEIIAISLEHGESLAPGAILYEDDDRIVAIELLAEDVLKIIPQGNIEWARAAFNIGNMHQAAYVHEDYILVAYDAILESIINKLGVKCERLECSLDGIRANVAQTDSHSHSHVHSHDHSHSHEHSHDHSHEQGDHHHG